MAIICGGVVLGYDLVELPNEGKKRKNTRLEINEKEANTVRRIFELYSQGHGYKAVVNRINKEGHKTKRNGEFAVSTVKEILQNPVYIGKIRYNVRHLMTFALLVQSLNLLIIMLKVKLFL